jgi:hypothetical protein
MSDVSYAGPLGDWLAQAPPAPPPRVMGKSLAQLLGPYLGIKAPDDAAGPRPMTMAQPDVIGNRPDVQAAVKAAGASAVEPFGQLGRVMTGTSQDTLGDIVGAAAGLAPIGPPGVGKALKAGAEAVESGMAKKTIMIPAYRGVPEFPQGKFYRGTTDFWATENPDLASQYAVTRPFGKSAPAPGVMPLMLDSSKLKTVDAGGKTKREFMGDIVKAMTSAKRGGKSGLRILNMYDEPRETKEFGPQTHYKIWDPSAISGKFAKTDPQPENWRDEGLWNIMLGGRVP